MNGPAPIIAPEVARYLERTLPPREGILARLEEEAEREGWPIIPPGSARFLEILVRMLEPARVLEVGTAIGYSGIVIAAALPPRGHLDTIEVDPETAARAEANFEEAGLGPKVTVHRGPALEVLAALEHRYDLVFVDAAKEEYSSYLDLALPLMPTGATVLADNLLWGGRVARGSKPDPHRERTTAAIRNFNERFLHHPDLSAQIVPIGDGLGVGVRLSPSLARAKRGRSV